ncbi:insect cuticle protein domain-containing protein [Phthorimaea operculella]|nr:insect cuticle protein domain-containing protein [Phthorimaea operculella]
MRLICFWCVLLAGSAYAQQGGFYAPQTFQNNVNAGLFRPMHRPWNSLMQLPNRLDAYSPKGLFTPASRNDVDPQSSIAAPWRPAVPAPVHEPWREPASYQAASPLPKPEPWRAPLPYTQTKEQQAAILHHKQALTSEGGFRFEYASDNGLAAGEVIEPDGSRVGAYQYKDPSGQLVKLKYRAGKDGFQILEGSHLPKSPEPVAPARQEQHYQQAYAEQRRQFELQQQYNQQRPEPQQQSWRDEGNDGRPAGGQYFTQNWRPGQEDDGQYRENEVENRGPHTFGEGFAFSFQG